MKKTIKTCLLLGFLLMMISVMAQPGGGRGGRGDGGGEERSQMSPEERQQRTLKQRQTRNDDLRSQLTLSDDVALRVDSINAKYDAQQDALFNKDATSGATDNEGAPKKDFRAIQTQTENINNARNAEVKLLLNAEQQKLYDKYLKEQSKNKHQRGGRGRQH